MLVQQQAISPLGGYNEVIFDSATWVQNLPRTVMAIYVWKNAEARAVENSRNVHANFLKSYGLTENDVPLVTYDQDSETSSWFELLPAA